MNLIIKQSTSTAEILSSSNVVETLYQLTKPDPVYGLPAANAVLVGRIQVPAAYEDAVSFLNTQFSADNSDNGSDFQVTVLNNNYYIRFVDPEVVRVLTARGLIEEGGGLTVTQARNVDLGADWFLNNSLIETFNESNYFSGIIQSNCFKGCSGLTSINLTNVTTMGINAFRGCANLEKFNGDDSEIGVLRLPNLVSWSNYQFDGCKKLEKVVSLGTVTSLPVRAFYNCSSLTEITLPPFCTSLFQQCCAGCTGLTTINISQIQNFGVSGGEQFNNCSNLEYFNGPESTRGELYLPNVTGILKGGAFKGCAKLTSVTSLGSITTIESSAFENCTNLSTINIPNTVTSVGANAFNNTAWFNNQPDGGVVIGSCLYKYKGTAIGTYTIPSNITSITDSCFYGQSSLTGITSWPSSQNIIPNACFQNSGLASFDLTDIVTIEGNAFRNSKLTSIVIPNSVTTLGDDCFSQCSDLTSITIGTGITRLGRNIFSSCNSLETLVIPSNVKSLERDTLINCKSLQWVRLESTTMVSLFSADCFNNTNNCIIYVPSDLVDTYKADSKWSSLASRIQAIPTV